MGFPRFIASEHILLPYYWVNFEADAVFRKEVPPELKIDTRPPWLVKPRANAAHSRTLGNQGLPRQELGSPCYSLGKDGSLGSFICGMKPGLYFPCKKGRCWVPAKCLLGKLRRTGPQGHGVAPLITLEENGGALEALGEREKLGRRKPWNQLSCKPDFCHCSACIIYLILIQTARQEVE